MSTGVQPPGSTLGAAGTAAAAAEGVPGGLSEGRPERDGPSRQPGGLAVTEVSMVTKRSPRRPNIVARLAAGAGVVVAALTPIAVVVFLILHAVNALTFT
jgi:H+/Cl- antiporter ClcA